MSSHSGGLYIKGSKFRNEVFCFGFILKVIWYTYYTAFTGFDLSLVIYLFPEKSNLQRTDKAVIIISLMFCILYTHGVSDVVK